MFRPDKFFASSAILHFKGEQLVSCQEFNSLRDSDKKQESREIAERALSYCETFSYAYPLLEPRAYYLVHVGRCLVCRGDAFPPMLHEELWIVRLLAPFLHVAQRNCSGQGCEK